MLAEISGIQRAVISVKYSRLFRQSPIAGRGEEPMKDRLTVQLDVVL